MRGLTISAHGGLDQLEYRTDLPKPEPRRGEVRIRVKAAALNHLDLFVVAGMPGVKITPRAFGRDRRMPIVNRYVPNGARPTS